jgi:hypothetical protein
MAERVQSIQATSAMRNFFIGVTEKIVLSITFIGKCSLLMHIGTHSIIIEAVLSINTADQPVARMESASA